MSLLLDTNIDAVTAWRFGGLRIDNIPRSLWYTPQHTTSIALGLIGLFFAATGGIDARVRAIAGAGLALGLSTTMNPLLGGICSILYGLCVLYDAAVQRAAYEALGDAARALRVRSLVAEVAAEVLDRTGRALGAGPLSHDEAHARRVADLTVYIRQHHAERDLAALGAMVTGDTW